MHLCAIANAATKRDTNLKSSKAQLGSIAGPTPASHPLCKEHLLRDNNRHHQHFLERNVPHQQQLHYEQSSQLNIDYLNDNDPQNATTPLPENIIINSANNHSTNNNLIDVNGITQTTDSNTIARQHHVHYTAYDLDKCSQRFILPGVSIIKPIVGVDKNLEENLETFFQMNYPKYELLFCIQDIDDESISIVHKLINKYPHLDSRLFIGGKCVGVNPKINNMQPAYEAANHELILISDSGISMKTNTLFDMVLDMRDNVALVHQMPFVRDGRKGFVSIFEKVYFGTAHARAYLTADLLGINCPTGMSALMRKYLIDEVGGIKSFGQYLAEDFFFAKSFTDRGWEISISRQPAWQNSSSGDTIWTLYSRIERWIKLRFAMVPHWTLLEPFSECLLLGVIESSIHAHLWAFNPFIFFLTHVLVWLLFDYKLLCTIQGGPLGMKIHQFLLAWLLRESTALIIFIKALCNPLVTWRDKNFKLKWGGLAEEVTPTCKRHEELLQENLEHQPQQLQQQQQCGSQFQSQHNIYITTSDLHPQIITAS